MMNNVNFSRITDIEKRCSYKGKETEHWNGELLEWAKIKEILSSLIQRSHCNVSNTNMTMSVKNQYINSECFFIVVSGEMHKPDSVLISFLLMVLLAGSCSENKKTRLVFRICIPILRQA